MPRPHSLLTPHLIAAENAVPVHEPALTQLRALAREDLGVVVRKWLDRRGADRLRVAEPKALAPTYHAELALFGAAVRLGVRVHQRKNRLQAHHVEAFAGYLLRAGLTAGVLVTTGPCSPAAMRAAVAFRSPRVLLLDGEEWTADLARCRTGLKRRNFWRAVLDFQALVRHRKRPGPETLA